MYDVVTDDDVQVHCFGRNVSTWPLQNKIQNCDAHLSSILFVLFLICCSVFCFLFQHGLLLVGGVLFCLICKFAKEVGEQAVTSTWCSLETCFARPTTAVVTRAVPVRQVVS